MEHDVRSRHSLQLQAAYSQVSGIVTREAAMSSGATIHHLPRMNGPDDTKNAPSGEPSQKEDQTDDEKEKAKKRARRKAKREQQDADDDGSDDPDDDDEGDEEEMHSGVAGRARARENARCRAILQRGLELNIFDFAKEVALNTRLSRGEGIRLLESCARHLNSNARVTRGALADRMAQADIPLVSADGGNRSGGPADRALAEAERARPGSTKLAERIARGE